MVVTIGYGEDNDLHPLDKRHVAQRLATAAESLVYGRDREPMGPPLTTVHQPLQEMASLATRLIMDIHANRVLLRTTILPVGLVVRNSTCAPRTVD